MNRNPFRKTVGFYEVMTTSYTSGTKSETAERRDSEKGDMENYGTTAKSAVPESVKGNTNDSPRNVGFNLKDSHSERKKKYLTAKYGAHQMLLIKKRLAVEMWIFDELRNVYGDMDYDCDLELEEVLNLDTDNKRRQYAYEQLQDAKHRDQVNGFVEELVKRAKTL